MIEALPLHDATLKEVRVAWRAGQCTFDLDTGGGSGRLIFDGLSRLELSKRDPWGSSVSINAISERAPGTFEIEVQSGDIIRVEAGKWRFEPGGQSSER